MTAEVGIMNRLGVALAADSAVTVEPSAAKIYTSAEKLFLLAENAPVGIMVYGDANVLGVPWETIIKIYRRRLSQRTFPALEEYVNDFLLFLGNSENLFPASAQEEFVESRAAGFCFYLLDELGERLDAEAHSREITEDDIEEIFSALIRDELDVTQEFDLLDQLPDNFTTIIRERYHTIITSVENQVFGSLLLSETVVASLTESIIELFKRRRLGITHSGIVIAGFGEKEHFPSLIDLQIMGMAANQLLFHKAHSTTIGDDTSAYVASFAQREMVHAFMEGINPDLREMIKDSTVALFHGVVQAILDEVKERDPELGEDLEERVSTTLDEILRILLEQWDTRRQEDYVDPILDMVEVLPKDELAAMAESLVNLTKFKRRVTKEQETVGGPIDVAVITKGDGFVWVKRKHYFRAELNPRFLARYHKKEGA